MNLNIRVVNQRSLKQDKEKCSWLQCRETCLVIFVGAEIKVASYTVSSATYTTKKGFIASKEQPEFSFGNVNFGMYLSIYLYIQQLANIKPKI